MSQPSTSNIVTVVLVLVASLSIFLVAWTWQNTIFTPVEEFESQKSKVTGIKGVSRNTDDTDAEKDCEDAFMTALGRAPYDNERAFYTEELRYSRLSKEDVISLLRISTALSPPTQHEKYPDRKAYGEIVDVFASTLHRLPDDRELDLYYAAFTSGSMTRKTLSSALKGSSEFNVRDPTFMKSTREIDAKRVDASIVNAELDTSRVDSELDANRERKERRVERVERVERKEKVSKNPSRESERDVKSSKDSKEKFEDGDGDGRGNEGDHESKLTDAIVDAFVRITGDRPDDETLSFAKTKFGKFQEPDLCRIAKFVKGIQMASEELKFEHSDNTLLPLYANDEDDLYRGLEVSNGISRDSISSRGISRSTKFDEDDLVLSRKFNWSMPRKRPPVCVPNFPCPVLPQLSQTSLIGTLLTEARDTKVGSILPSFKYSEDE